jgi:integral membrane protein (TIGR01906 family)
LTSKPTWLLAVAQLARAVIVLAVPIILTMFVVRLVMTPAFMQFEYTRPGFPADLYGFTTEERLQYGPILTEYLLNDENILFLADQRLPRDRVPPDVCIIAAEDDTLCHMFNERELRHMVDVKVVARAALRVGWISALVMVGAGTFLFLSDRKLFWQSFLGGGGLTLTLIIAIIAGALLAWDAFFTGFHTIFFEGDSWLFRFSDTLIRLFPEQFWFDAAVVVGATTPLLALLIVIIAGFQLFVRQFDTVPPSEQAE